VFGEEDLPVDAPESSHLEHTVVNCQTRPVSSSSHVSIEDTKKLDSKGECSMLV
jgi:hypothetical protein